MLHAMGMRPRLFRSCMKPRGFDVFKASFVARGLIYTFSEDDLLSDAIAPREKPSSLFCRRMWEAEETRLETWSPGLLDRE